MTPQEHFDKAERLLNLAVGEQTEWRKANYNEAALVHATLAHAGFVRDAATKHTHPFIEPGTLRSILHTSEGEPV